MKRTLLALIVLGVVELAAGRPQDAARSGPSGPRLRIDAVAFDREGRTVDDLKREDFEVWINRFRVPIESVTALSRDAERSGRLTVLVLDDVASAPEIAPRVRQIARRFVNRMSPGDEMAVVALNGDQMKATDDRARLIRSIEDYRGLALGVMRLDMVGEHVLTTMASLSRSLAEAPGRKTIVGIGAAWLFDTPIPPPTIGRNLRPEWVDAVRGMAFANATMYVIDPGGVGTSLFGGGTSGFARETGGYAFINTNDVDGAVERVMRESGTGYVIEVADPPVGRKADLRELEVRSLRRGVTARARRWIPGRQ